MRFDMRAPAFGAPATELYAAALDMSAWAETRGCLAVVLCEHHGAADGYLPAPMILGTAIAARTTQVMLTLTMILPLYDPVRLAEEIAVLDIISRGRASYVFGLGYRREEFEHFGINFATRGRICDQKLDLVRRLLTGTAVTYDGRRIQATPRPSSVQGPLMMWGGGTVAAARRAGRYGLGYLAQGDAPGSLEAYQRSCRKHGNQPAMTLLPKSDTPTVCFVAPDVERAWQELGPHLLHDAKLYAEWNPDNQTSAGIAEAADLDTLRRTSRTYRIFTADEAITHVRGGGMLTLAPLCGGIPAATAWKYLRYLDQTVIPSLRQLASTAPRVEQ